MESLISATTDATTTSGGIKQTLSDLQLFSLSLSDVLSALVLLGICLVVVKLLLRIVDRSFDRLRIDRSLRAFVRSGVRLLLYFVVVLIVADSLGIPVTSLIAMLSVVGLALSLAVQGALANLAGGVLLLTTKPFAVGDYVEAGGVGGTVGEIGLFYTQLVTPDNKVIYVPNGEISGGKIQNYNAKPTRRVELTVSASYDDATQTVKQAIFAAIATESRILSDPAPFVNILSYGDSAISYLVRVWTSSADCWDVQFTLTEAIRAAFEQHGVTMTYNHLNVHLAHADRDGGQGQVEQERASEKEGGKNKTPAFIGTQNGDGQRASGS